MHNALQTFDIRATALLKWIPSGWYPFVSAFTWLGSPSIVIAIALLVATYSYKQQQLAVVYAFLAVPFAIGLNTIVKHIFRRDRPDTMYVADMFVKSYSFPSGHAFSATVLYGLLAYLALSRIPQPYGLIVAAGLVLLVVLIGASRVYLGAHFPSDVVAGWLFGCVCVAAIIKLCKL